MRFRSPPKNINQLDNKSPEEMEPYIAQLFDNAQTSLFISSKFHPEFYNRPKIRDSFSRCLDRIDVCRILVDSDVSWDERSQQLPWLNDLIIRKNIPIKRSKSAVLHWIIVDDRDVRLEKPHRDNQQRCSNRIIKGVEKPMMDMIKDTFNYWWVTAVAIQPNNNPNYQ